MRIAANETGEDTYFVSDMENITDTPQEPTGTLDIDGMEHLVPGRLFCWCGGLHGMMCECGGFLHYQGVYDGDVLICEDCALAKASNGLGSCDFIE